MRPNPGHAGQKGNTQTQSGNQSTPANAQQKSAFGKLLQLTPKNIAGGSITFVLGIIGNLVASEFQNRLVIFVVLAAIVIGSAFVAWLFNSNLPLFAIILVLGLVLGLLGRDLVDPLPRTSFLPASNTALGPNVTPSPVAANASASPTVMTYTFDVSGLTKTNVPLLPGDKVKIEADGVIKAGGNVGDVRPEGKRTFVFGPLTLTIDAETYNIVPDYPHGMLMYRVRAGNGGSSSDWGKCGEDCELSIEANETLELEVNDSVQRDNEGEFQVTLIVER